MSPLRYFRFLVSSWFELSNKYHFFYVVLVVKLLFSLTSLVTSPAGGSVSDSGIDPE
jgi:hypothetical protein